MQKNLNEHNKSCQQLIEIYCDSENIDIPSGFYRRSPGHLAVIKKKQNEWQLVATTWTKTADVIYYLMHNEGSDCRIFDFKKGLELGWNGSKRLRAISNI